MRKLKSVVLANGVFLAWLISLISTLGALFIGEVMGQAPCKLCWYQRIAMFPLPIILGVALYFGETNIRRYTLPLAAIGIVIAGWHSLVYSGFLAAEILPCDQSGQSCSSADMTIFGGVPIPFLSFAAFLAIFLLLLPRSVELRS